MQEQAIAKIDKELKEFKGEKAAELISVPVADALKKFIQQDKEFAQAVCEQDKTLSDCLKEVTKDAREKLCISDIEAYTRAVMFYFPGAGINVSMDIDLCASVRQTADSSKKINLSLNDLLEL